MPGYQVREIEHAVAGRPFRLRVLSDTQQFADPDGHGERAGISSATWSLFGQLWPAGALLAHAMERFDIEGKRILELGCGIGLASLVLQRRGVDVVASDMHPLAEPFLAYNAALNALPAVHFRHLRWAQPLPTLGQFDLLIASDVLYERGHAELLAGVVERHVRGTGEVMITDPGRGHSGGFTRLLEAQGFALTHTRCAMDHAGQAEHGSLLHYRRGLVPATDMP